jgi:hypothetical protein
MVSLATINAKKAAVRLVTELFRIPFDENARQVSGRFSV